MLSGLFRSHDELGTKVGTRESLSVSTQVSGRCLFLPEKAPSPLSPVSPYPNNHCNCWELEEGRRPWLLG